MQRYIIILILLTLISCKDQVTEVDSRDPSGSLTPIVSCQTDNLAPQMSGVLTVDDSGSSLSSAQVSWGAAVDNCGVDHYEVAIGTQLGSSDILSFANIGNVTSKVFHGLNLSYAQNYFFSVRAVDQQGNVSTPLHSGAWQIFTPQSLTNLVMWLDASNLSSLQDQNGKHPQEITFTGEVAVWQDISNSQHPHHFSSSTPPHWNSINQGVRFSGTQQFMLTADHADLNLSTIAQRTVTMVFKSSNDIGRRQVLYEEGGTVRGINLYIDQGKMHCGFWNIHNDGDGVQPYVELQEAIQTSSLYVVTLLIDYTNYNGANGVDGKVECVINSMSMGSAPITSRLFAHSGNIGLGAVNEHTVFADGSDHSGHNFYFQGEIFEFMMHNDVQDLSFITRLHNILLQKWR